VPVEIKEKLDKLAKREGWKKTILKELRALVEETRDPWIEVRGLLKRKTLHPLRTQRKLRREWEA
jgi:hypothetical protein